VARALVERVHGVLRRAGRDRRATIDATARGTTARGTTAHGTTARDASATRARRGARCVVLALLPTLAACGPSLRTAPSLVPHSLFVDGTGTARRTMPDAGATRMARASGEALDASALGAQLHAMMETVRAQPGREVVLYVHGGLTSPSFGARRARARLGAMAGSGVVPLFLHWDSALSPTHTVVQLPSVVVRGALGAPGQWGRAYVAGCRTTHALLHDGAFGAHGGSITEARRCPGRALDAAETTSIALERASVARAASPGTDLAGADTLPRLHVEPQRPGALVTAGRIALAVATAVPKLVTGPLMGASGASTYAELRVRAERTAAGAGAALLDSLGALLAAECATAAPGPCPRRVTLVGFSMGAIVLNELLAARPGLPVQRVVHLAPAASIAETYAAMVPLLRARPDATFRIAVLHPTVEADEIRALDLLPRGSLLEWIDAGWSGDETMSARTTGRWSGALAFAALAPASVRGRIAVEAFGNDAGTRARLGHGVRRHAAFGDPWFAFWADSSWATARPQAARRRPSAAGAW
jgi:hypothetical protein